MSTSNKIVNKRSSDPIDRLIFENNLRAKSLLVDKELGIIVLIFNTGNVLKANIADFPRLRKASSKELGNWKLTGGGTGIRWSSLDEDLSIRGFIKDAAVNEVLKDFRVGAGRGKNVA